MNTSFFANRRKASILLLGLLWASLLIFAADSDAQAAAPVRTQAWCTAQTGPGAPLPLCTGGQPYAEATLCARPDVIFCEDFNYPGNFFFSGVVQGSNSNWFNPGLTTGLKGFIYGFGRQLNLASQYPTKPRGAMPSGSQPDGVWVANWDPSKGQTGDGSTWANIRDTGGTTYANGTLPTTDLYVRFQFYVTANYVWPGDPKLAPYGWGAEPSFDNKLFYMFPPEGESSPTSSAYSAGLATQTTMFSPDQVANFADGLTVRYGDPGDNFKFMPLCGVCVNNDPFNNYTFQSLTLRNPNDQPLLRRAFRFNTNRWYTVEFRYLVGTEQALNGTIQVWIDGTLIYSESALRTCGSGLGGCGSVGLINLDAYHNNADVTNFNGQQVIDNLIISRSYIGPPGGGNPPPAPPTGLQVTQLKEESDEMYEMYYATARPARLLVAGPESRADDVRVGSQH